MRNIILMTSCAVAALVAASCTKDASSLQGRKARDEITLGSYRSEAATRAGGVQSFAEGTRYTLLSVLHEESAADYAWATGKGFDTQPTVGTETGIHTISYSPVSVFPQAAELDFFAVTYGDGTAPSLDAPATDGNTPSVTIADDGGALPDLMHSNTVKRRKASDGTVILPFEHALSSVSFLVSKQDENGDEPFRRQLEHVRITGIRIDNAAKRATMDAVTGGWSWSAADVGSRTVWADPAGEALQVTPRDVPGHDVLVFPNDDGDDTNNIYDPANPYRYRKPSGDESAEGGEQLIVTVTLEGLEIWDELALAYVPLTKTLADGTEVTDGRCEISCPMRVYDDGTGKDLGPMHLGRNMKYTVAVLVMRDNVKIITVSPHVYEWVDEDLTDEATTYGQPVVFGDVVWMDRNLGASSADCENDWLNTLGYWFEYARNVPFMMDMDVFRANGYKISSGNVLVDADGRTVAATPGEDPAWDDYFIYTYDNEGRKVSGFRRTTLKALAALPENDGKGDREIVAIDPGDAGSYDYLWYSSGGSFWYYAGAHSFTNTYWYTVSQQPVPKGWRLPTAKDVYSIMPEESFNWYSSSARYVVVGVPTPKATSGTAKTYAGNYKYQFIYGNVKVDPEADPEEEFSAPIRTAANKTRLYGIKYQGTDKAYRYMIEMHESDIERGDWVRFSQFPASADDIFVTEGSGNARTWNLHQFDWEHPSAYLDFPLQGQLGNGTVTLFGRELKLRLLERNGSGTFCMKLSNDGTGVANTYQSTTCPTRLVRDFNAN